MPRDGRRRRAMRPSSPPWITASAPSRSTSSVVALGADHEAMHRGERGEVDEVERPHHAARRREGGDHRQHVAGHRIAELVDRAGMAEIGGHLELRLGIAAAVERHRLGGREDDVAERQHPRAPLGAERRQPLGGQVETDDLRVARAEDREATGDRRQRREVLRLGDARSACRTASRRCRRGGTPRRRCRARTGRPAAPCRRRRVTYGHDRRSATSLGLRRPSSVTGSAAAASRRSALGDRVRARASASGSAGTMSMSTTNSVGEIA